MHQAIANRIMWGLRRQDGQHNTNQFVVGRCCICCSSNAVRLQYKANEPTIANWWGAAETADANTGAVHVQQQYKQPHSQQQQHGGGDLCLNLELLHGMAA
jgi:hypothetical protein